MYDILQLNDMLVPELLDIAEQLKIPNAKKLTNKTWSIKYLTARPLPVPKALSPPKMENGNDCKTTTSIGSEEAVVESGDEEKTNTKNPICL